MTLTKNSFDIPSLPQLHGGSHLPSPLTSIHPSNFINDDKHRVLFNIYEDENPENNQLTYERAGPRQDIYWNPEDVRAAIVTCGGLAPGLNNVIQSLVAMLNRYGVKYIYGVPFGYAGFHTNPETGSFHYPWRHLNSKDLSQLNSEAGSFLGTSRGHSDAKTIVDALVNRNINMIFTIGGDGTLRGANAIYEEAQKRKLPISVVGIPKTIDNDILYVSKSFGFETAVEKATEALQCAHVEARSVINGVGIVKIMGRNSGALTANAAAACTGVDFVIVPEIPLKLEGENGFLNVCTERLIQQNYITIAVAEGTGQDLIDTDEVHYDASGNKKLKNIGLFLKDKLVSHFKEQEVEYSMKYIDPSYMVRSQVTTSSDSLFCSRLGQNAAHAAMAGKTGLMIGLSHNHFTHVPLSLVSQGKKELDINGPLWMSVMASTGQPASWE